VDGAVRYVIKLTNALKCMKVYYTHCIPPTCFATHVAILGGGGAIRFQGKDKSERTRYTKLNFEKNVWFKIKNC